MTINWKNYNSKNSYDEYLTPEKSLRKEAKVISKILNSYSIKDLERIEQNCQSTISSRGINFKVYSADKKAAEEKKWPLDIIPRIILKSQWLKVRKGLIQRCKALNLFINDVYNQKKIFKDNIVPKELVFKSANDAITYTSSNVTYEKFKTFAIKIALTSNNATVIPKVRDMRAIALDE